MRSTLDVEGGRAQLAAGRTTFAAGGSLAVGPPCQPGPVQVSARDLARVPVTNLRVSRGEFGEQWIVAERRCDEQAEQGVTDWYAAGIAATCEWLATAVVRPASEPHHPAYSPGTGRRRGRRSARAVRPRALRPGHVWSSCSMPASVVGRGMISSPGLDGPGPAWRALHVGSSPMRRNHASTSARASRTSSPRTASPSPIVDRGHSRV
jgi:hypothetical protein